MSDQVAIACYKQSSTDCDEYEYVCEECGRTVCYSHSKQVYTTGCDDPITACEDCGKER